ncbi:MAG: zf-HC2 domain-containing protein, partial [Acidobacteria bacterium]|nr:zf-HC2 domain-containing protein [Acidobacteriota bacterium]
MTEEHPTKEELAELIDGRLEREVRAAVEAHLSSCVACRNDLEAQRSAKSFAALHFAPTPVPPQVSSRV